MPRCGFFWLISYDGFCDDSQNPNNNVSCLVWRLQRGCSGVHGCLVPFDILNASRCIISSCWWFHPWFRCGVLWLWLILNMLRHGFHSRANDGFWGELQNRGVGCLVMLDDGSWVNRETLTVGLELTDLGWFHPTTCRALCGAFNVDVAVCLKAWSPFDILNASRCIVSSCWWFHPWFRCGVLWLWLILNMLRHGFHSRANDGFWGELQNRGGGAGIDGFGVISPNNVPWLVWHLQRGCSRVLESLVPFDILNASRCIVSSCWWFHPWSHDGIRVPRKLPAHTRWLLRLYLEWLKVGSVAWLPHFEHVRMLLFRWGGQATTLFVFSVPNKYLNYGYLVMPSEADMAPFDVSICLHAFAIAGCGSLHGVGSSRREGLLAGMMVDFDTMHAFHFRFAFVHSYCDNACTMSLVIDGCYLVDPASSHMLVSKIKPCMCNNSRANTCNKPRLLEGMHLLDKRSTQALPVALMIHDNSSDRTALVPAMHHSNFCPINFRWEVVTINNNTGLIESARSWTLGWVDRSASGVHRLPRPFCRRCAPGLNWPGRASGAVTLKKLECSKQAYALDTLAWDNTTGF
ncbi:hypothetical protein VNO77_45562 [Canavalia gladiata]|uniref:Uncharacterized protein n=1 Tax=Canavalia gladiata TaxID=3824 RepID=A0AAN9PHI0_CANGL